MNRETKQHVMFPNRMISHWNDIVGLVKNSNSVDNCESGSGCKKRETVPQKVKVVLREAHFSINDTWYRTKYTHKAHTRHAI